MKHLLKCRRTFICVLTLLLLFVLGWRGANVAEALAAVAIGLSAANAGEAFSRKAKEAPRATE